MRVAWIRSAPGCADSPPQRCSRSPRCWPSGAAATSGSPASGWRSWPACCSRSPRSWPSAPLPRSRNGRLALGGLAALTAWTGLSLLWAPVGGPAFADLERLILYTAAFGAGIVLLKGIDWVEPASAGHDRRHGRLRAVGAAAPDARSAPDAAERRRPARAAAHVLERAGRARGARARARGGPRRARATASAAAARAGPRPRPLSDALARRDRRRPRRPGGAARAAAHPRHAPRGAGDRRRAPALAAVAALALPGVADVDGSSGQGAAMIAVLLVLSGAAAFMIRGRDAPLPVLRPLAARGAGRPARRDGDRGRRQRQPGPGELRRTPSGSCRVQSNRYAYWRVAVGVFADHPLAGVGSGAFARRVAAAAGRSPRACATRTSSTWRPRRSWASSACSRSPPSSAGSSAAAPGAAPPTLVAALVAFAPARRDSTGTGSCPRSPSPRCCVAAKLLAEEQ